MGIIKKIVKRFIPRESLSLVRHFPSHTKKFIKTVLYQANIYKLLKKKFKGINLGAGEATIPTFFSIDASPYVLSDVVGGIEKIKLADNSVDLIYNSHVFEHVPRAEANQVLKEWHRVLSPGGKLFLAMPDLEALFNIYLKNLPNYSEEEAKYKVELSRNVIYGGQTNKFDFHFNGYSFTTLSEVLKNVGFSEIKRFDRNEVSFIPEVDASRAEISGDPISLNIEATK